MNIFRKSYWDLNKPLAATHEEWQAWHARVQQEKLIPYVIKEEIPQLLSDAWYRAWKPYKTAIWWVRHRTTDRNHMLRSGLKPGYHDKPELMLHVNMQMLVDYVEIECAHMAVMCLEDWAHKRPNWIKRWLGIPLRCADAGIAYLEAPLEHDAQDQLAVQAEMVHLYRWWCQVRPCRPDPYEASGWTEFCAQRANILSFDPALDDQSAQILENLRAMEEAYDQEDQHMLHRLIDIRQHMWC